jgi:SAM-dependent methyltransferase
VSNLPPVDVTAGFNARAQTYDNSAAHRWQAAFAVSVATIGEEDDVLDVATGTGLALRTAGSAAPGVLRVGVDIADQLLDVARAALPTARFVHADAANIPLPDARVDVVLCVASLPYFPDPVAAAIEWRRVLRPTGRLIVTVPTDAGLTSFRLLRQAAQPLDLPLPEPTGGVGSPAGAASWGRRAGFRLLRSETEPWREPFHGDPAEVFDHLLAQGLAEQVRTSSPSTRSGIRARFLELAAQAVAERVPDHTIVAHLFSADGSPR